MRLQLSRAFVRSIALAVLALFAFAPLAAAQEASSSGLEGRATSEIGAYADTDHVFVLTPSVAGTVSKPTAGWSVGGSYLVDVVSAASVDIVSTASRRWEEVRQAGTVDASYKPGNFGVDGSAAVSYEPDYTSVTGGILLSQDLMSKNLTLLFGYEHAHDVAGRSGTPSSVFAHVIDNERLKLGLTRVIDAATIGSLLLDADFERGDTSKPYRYIPMFAPGTNVAQGASIDTVMALRLPERVLEQLPTSRQRYALTGRIAHRFHASTLRFDERGYVDTWGIKASTSDARWLLDAGSRVTLGPHLRFHAQTPVDFWQRAYVVNPGFDFPALRTGDRELGPLVNFTGGGTFRVGIGDSMTPKKWVIGLDANVTSTHYLDDLYVTSRLSVLGACRGGRTIAPASRASSATTARSAILRSSASPAPSSATRPARPACPA